MRINGELFLINQYEDDSFSLRLNIVEYGHFRVEYGLFVKCDHEKKYK